MPATKIISIIIYHKKLWLSEITKKRNLKTMPKIEIYIYTFTEYLLCLQSNERGSFFSETTFCRTATRISSLLRKYDTLSVKWSEKKNIVAVALRITKISEGNIRNSNLFCLFKNFSCLHCFREKLENSG